MAALDIPGAFGTRNFSLRVPVSMYTNTRKRLVAKFMEQNAGPAILLFRGGEQETRYDSDHEPLFRQESFFLHLFGVTEPDCYATIEVPSGKCTLYVPKLPQEYAMWSGPIKSCEAIKDNYGVDDVCFVHELNQRLCENPDVAATLNGSATAPVVHTCFGLNSDSGNSGPPLPNFEGFEKIPSTHAVLRDCAVEVRVVKSDEEIAMLQRVNDIGSEAHMACFRHAKPGLRELQIEAVFLHHCYYNGGCRYAPYTQICGCGINAATLHYGHAGAPNDFELEDGQMMMCDMGCEQRGYGSDISCSFPVNGKFTADQKKIFDTVALAQTRVMQAMKPGVEWLDMHDLALRTVTEGLTEMGILVGPIDEMMKAGVGAYFMPHGLGHLIGVDTHDVGGYPTGGKPRDSRPGYRNLRMNRPLIENMVLTVEPGCYFIEYLLNDLESNAETKCFVVKEKLDQFRKFGGMRLEDSVVVTADGCYNLTTCPRTTEDVEAVMAGTLTDRTQLKKLF